MKKPIIITAALLGAACLMAAGLTCKAATSLWKRIKGSDTIVTKTIDTPDFEAITASRSVRVIVADRTGETTIEANGNLMDWVVVEATDGTLQVTIDKSISSISNADVTVTVPGRGRTIRSLEASSAASIESKVTLRGERTRLEASSAAKIAAKVETTNCAASASSAANVTLEGSAGYLRADASSAGKVEAGKLTAKRAKAKASSGADINLDCAKELEANASSGASIRYTGDCAVDAQESSGGSVRRK